MISVVIPAHNESRVIGRLLFGLAAGAAPGEFDIVVVANGCTDDTAARAAATGPQVRVLSTPVASKAHALRLGDEHARGYPRIYLDADVELTAGDVRALAAALAEPGVLAVAPSRTVAVDRSPWPVRWYYDFWQRLPSVRSGLYGRGVVAVGEPGHARIAALPPVMNDDLAASLAFAPHERRIVPDATVVVRAPRTLGDLIRRRTRAVTGTAQLAGAATAGAARTTKGDLLGVLRADPAAAPRLAVFLAVTAVVRRRARRRIRSGDYTTWLRDESSRVADVPVTEPRWSPPRIAVVVVTWNSAAVLPGLLSTLDAGLAGLDHEVIVVDNASADDSVAVARRRRPDCRIVQTGRNAGYAAAINAGVARADRYDAYLVLNPDIRLDPGAVAAMYARLADDGVGIAVPRLYHGDGRLAWSLRREPTLPRALGEAVLGDRAGRRPWTGERILDVSAYRRPTTVDWATGAALLVSAACARACGPWDESFFLYSEETEYALRARDLGFATRLEPAARAVHLEGESKISPRLWSLLTINRVRLYRRRHGALPALAYWAVMLTGEAARAALGRPRSRRAVAALVSPGTWAARV